MHGTLGRVLPSAFVVHNWQMLFVCLCCLPAAGA